MSVLSDLLGAGEPGFTTALHELEVVSGSPGVDLQVMSQIATRVHSKIRELGLDPMDTTGKELYHSLQGLIKVHDEFLMKALGGDDPDDTDDLLRRCIAATDKLPIPKQSWVLKHSVAKRLLQKTPPKKLMKQLSYRSIDSMLKRENVEELYAALHFLESRIWLEKFIKTYKSLKPSDFEMRDITIVPIKSEKWGQAVPDYVNQKRHNIITVKELGIIGVLPLPTDTLRGICITMLPMLLHYINEIRLYSSYFKLQQVKNNFDHVIIETLLSDAKPVATVANLPLHWRVIQRFYGRIGNKSHPEIFEPHIQPEDIEWRQAEEVMYRIEPALKFWEDVDYTGAMYNNYPVSFNLIDNILSYCNDLPYGQQSVMHFRSSLWDELLVHYLSQSQMEDTILGQLDGTTTKPRLAKQKRVG
jgi:hypothetical protein